MLPISIYEMTRDDLKDVYELEKTAFPIPWSISSLEEELNNTLATYLVAKIKEPNASNEIIVGYIGMWLVMDECHITNIAVHEKYRRQKIATSLFNKLFDLCKRNNIRYIMLEVRESNIIAQKMYEKFGFKCEIIRKGYYKNPDSTREDALVMEKEI